MTQAPDLSTKPGRSDALVMFGLTGDLGQKKLFQALAELSALSKLRCPVVGVGRSSYSPADLRNMFVDAVDDEYVSQADVIDFRYVEGDSADSETYRLICDEIEGTTNPAIYAAVPPDQFVDIGENLCSSELPDTTRFIVEKPFGHSRQSAEQLYDSLTSMFSQDRLFLVDHFLAKSEVENLVKMRAANPLLEQVMRGPTVRRIEFTMAEAFDISGRGGFYDDVGAVKDVFQNHILQTLAVLLMEPPTNNSAAAFDRSRGELLGSIRPIDPADVVLGQYDGYAEVDDVPDDSSTETYLACRLHVDNPRWSETEILVRTGKALASTYAEAIAVLADPSDTTPRNAIRFRLKPQQSVDFELAVWNVDAFTAHNATTPVPSEDAALGDYARMLDGALDGDHYHFARIADTIAAWGIVEPLLSIEEPPVGYAPGSMGPEQADRLVQSGTWIERSTLSGPAEVTNALGSDS